MGRDSHAVFYLHSSHGSVHRVLASAQVGSRVLHTGIAKTGVLLGFKSQTRQARVTCVPINIRRCWRSIRTGWRWHCRIQGGIAQVVQVIQAVEAGAGHPGDCRRYHAWGHTHGGYGVWRGEHALRRQRVDIHGVEKREAFGGQGSGGQALGCPVVVRVAGVHVIVGLHEAVKLRTEAIFTKLGLLVPFSLSPFGSAVLEPNLWKWGEREGGRWELVRSYHNHRSPLQVLVATAKPVRIEVIYKIFYEYIYICIWIYLHVYVHLLLCGALRWAEAGVRCQDSRASHRGCPSLARQIRGRIVPPSPRSPHSPSQLLPPPPPALHIICDALILANASLLFSPFSLTPHPFLSLLGFFTPFSLGFFYTEAI